MQPKNKANEQKLQTKILLGLCSLIFVTILTKSFILAASILAMLFVHENGHLWAARRRGLKTGGIYFLPGLGAVAIVNDEMYNRETECYVAIMGPIFGALYSFVFFAIYYLIGIFFLADVEMLSKISGTCAIINLFNFMPINPLDGGRIVKSIFFSIHRNFGLFMMYLMIAGSIWLAWNFHFIFWLITLGCMAELHAEKKDDKDITDDCPYAIYDMKVIIKNYHRNKPRMNFIQIVTYAVLCAATMWFLLLIFAISVVDGGLF